MKPETCLFSLEITRIWKALRTRGWVDGDREFPTLEEGEKPQTQANQVPNPIKAHPRPSFESLSLTKLILAVEYFQQVQDYFYASAMTMSHAKTRDWNRPFHSTPMKTRVACKGLALEGKERGVGRGWWKEKMALAPIFASFHGREECLRCTAGKSTHRREGKSTGLKGRSRQKHISIPHFKKGSFEMFSAPSPHFRTWLTHGRGNRHLLSCSGQFLEKLTAYGLAEKTQEILLIFQSDIQLTYMGTTLLVIKILKRFGFHCE